MNNSTSLPLDGLRVLDLSYVFAVPYIGALLADLGAEVIKVEAPNRLDLTRGMAFARYADNDPGKEPWNRSGVFNVLNRGKKSIALDLNSDEGKKLFFELLQDTDILLENFTPRVMRKWNMQYEELSKIKPSLIMLSNTGYGSGGPWSEFPSQGTTLEATMGLTQYTGYRNDKPWKAGQSYPDFLATWSGLLAIFAALTYRKRSGLGQWIDLGMYQVGSALIAEAILQYQIDGTDIKRTGNEDPMHVPSNIYQAKGEDRWVAISINSDDEWRILAKLMNCPELADDARYKNEFSRRERRDEIDKIVSSWTKDKDSMDLMMTLQNQGIACGPVFNSRDLLINEQLRHRNFYQMIEHKFDIGARPIIGRPYCFRNRKIKISKPAPGFGEDTQQILRYELNLKDLEIGALFRNRIVSDRPIDPGEAQSWNITENLKLKTLVEFDVDYKKNFPRE
ncbi:MAG: hypothetical protein RJB15_239 [Pseudomonadota bacterium]|jgi:crotonobetainyl-CoA:carnitine CoA-transferase CaiB-like acyl-CoA transferase